MGVEIERKFLVRNDLWRHGRITRSDHLVQGYLVGPAAADAELARCSIRVRLVGDHQAWLTIKSANAGLSRQEFEYRIPQSEAQAMLDSLGEGRIDKLRHHIDVEGAHFEVDEFLGDNAGLVVAEIELASEDSPFPRPEWLGQEVSHEKRYYNVELSRHPFCRWERNDPA